MPDSGPVLPLIGAILGSCVALIVHQADTHMTLPAGWQYTPATASKLLTAIVGATVGLTEFVVTVSVQLDRPHSGCLDAGARTGSHSGPWPPFHLGESGRQVMTGRLPE
jgi:hypothetical protein